MKKNSRPSTPSKPRLTEAHIEQACTDYLILDGWRPLKTEQNFSEHKLKSVGENGMADHLYIRYEPHVHYNGTNIVKNRTAENTVTLEAEAHVMWIEWKRYGGKTGQHQLDWNAKETGRGALALIAGIDFTPTIEGFRKWYQASGLARRVH